MIRLDPTVDPTFLMNIGCYTAAAAAAETTSKSST